jgi:hypothetical protein
MAIGKGSDFVIYNDEFYGGMAEAIAQNLAVFNAASAGSVRLVANQLLGDYNKESFLQDVANLITRRDLTSVSAATDLAMTQAEFIGVKVHRKIGPATQTLDAWRKIGKDSREMSFKLGGMIGERKTQDMINTSIMAVEAALEGQASQNHDGTGSTLTHGLLNTALSKMGDAGNRVVAWVMHSASWYQLAGQSITDKITNVADVQIKEGTAFSLGRPTIVTDAASLFEVGATTTGDDAYAVLGLVSGAVVCTESEEQDLVSEVVTGLEQLSFRIQGEYAFNLNMKGMQWDIGNGGANPLDTAIATTTNWDKIATDAKDLPGVRLTVDAA